MITLIDSLSDAFCLHVDQNSTIIQTAKESVWLFEIEIVEENVPFQSKIDTKTPSSCQVLCKHVLSD